VTPDRFRELTEIYGAEPRRWPAAERQAALAYMRDHAGDAEAALSEASTLDDLLGDYGAIPAGAVLREQIIASAPRGARSPARRMPVWWQAAGFAGLGLAGALAGALAISVVMPIDQHGDDGDGGYVITAFDEFSSQSGQ
jgi:hypothetical protein